MERNNRVLLMAVLIMLLSLVSFNFNREDVSGRSVAGGGTISVSPGVVNFYRAGGDGNYNGALITVTAKGTVDRNLYVYRSNGARLGSYSADVCGSRSRCDGGTDTIRLKSDLPDGYYYVQGPVNGVVERSRDFRVTRSA